jgi:prepilin-type N-terminal cleavage/methylation domain-containing protein
MRRRTGLTLIEVILALLVLGLLAALTIPRLSRAAGLPDNSALLRAHLRVLRCAIDRYYQDHGAYPGSTEDGRHAAGTPEAFVAQLTEFTDRAGRVSLVRDDVHCFGPYLRDGVPGNPLLPGCPAGVFMQSGAGCLTPVEEDGIGWVYSFETGQIIANLSGQDALGRAYVGY